MIKFFVAFYLAVYSRFSSAAAPVLNEVVLNANSDGVTVGSFDGGGAADCCFQSYRYIYGSKGICSSALHLQKQARMFLAFLKVIKILF